MYGCFGECRVRVVSLVASTPHPTATDLYTQASPATETQSNSDFATTYAHANFGANIDVAAPYTGPDNDMGARR